MRRLGWSTIAWVVLSVLTLLIWFDALRPTSLGGSTGYVTIRGTSMLPTYEPGDLVITREKGSYRTGDVVAYRVPEGDLGGGVVVIHRIIGGSAHEGFVLQGDNNPYLDDWYPQHGDIVGKAWLRIPRLGIVLGFLRDPLPLASLAAALVVVFVLFPSARSAVEPATGTSM
jgi:signal peptidase I